MISDHQAGFRKIKFLFLIFLLLLVSILSKLGSIYFELYSISALFLFIILSLSVFTGAIKWYGTVFLFIFFSSFQFIAMLVPTFFNAMPHYRFFESDSIAENYFTYYMLIFLCGYMLLLVTYKLSQKIKVPHYSLNCKDIPLILCYLPFIIAIFSFYKIFSAGGGFVNTILNMGSINSILAEVAMYGSLSKVGYTSCCMLLLVRHYRNCVFVFIVLTAMNAAMGERGAILFSGILPLLVTYRLSHGKISAKYIGIFLLIFFFYYSVLGAFRSANISEAKSEELTTEKVINVISKTEHHINAAATIQMADKDGYYFGETLINLIYVPIPRAIWSEKPIISESAIIGMQLKGTNNPTGSGLPPGVFAYGYIQFGLPGVILTALLSGLIAGIAEKYFLSVLTIPSILLYSQCQALFIHVLSTEVQVKFLVNLIVITAVIILSMIWHTFKKELKKH
tara:strand:- start:2127 stop:3482 length:1356 start_codon:yes stop_codon:yes gene_type:complete